MCIIRSMHADVPNHEPSLMLMNCGDGRLPRPSMGAWVTYGLGSENQNLPGFVAMCPGGYPIVATQNWRSAFLPGAYQGTYIDTQHTDVQKLIENIRNNGMTRSASSGSNSTSCASSTRCTCETRGPATRHWKPASSRSSWRIGCRSEAAEAFDINREPLKVRERYGTRHQRPAAAHHAPADRTRRALRAGLERRRPAVGQSRRPRSPASQAGRNRGISPIAAFLDDLKVRGLFDETLVMWGGEFGRTPVAELPRA